MRLDVVNLRSWQSPSLWAEGNPKLRRETRSRNSGHPEEREKEQAPICDRGGGASELGSQESPPHCPLLGLQWPVELAENSRPWLSILDLSVVCLCGWQASLSFFLSGSWPLSVSRACPLLRARAMWQPQGSMCVVGSEPKHRYHQGLRSWPRNLENATEQVGSTLWGVR